MKCRLEIFKHKLRFNWVIFTIAAERKYPAKPTINLSGLMLEKGKKRDVVFSCNLSHWPCNYMMSVVSQRWCFICRSVCLVLDDRFCDTDWSSFRIQGIDIAYNMFWKADMSLKHVIWWKRLHLSSDAFCNQSVISLTAISQVKATPEQMKMSVESVFFFLASIQNVKRSPEQILCCIDAA